MRTLTAARDTLHAFYAANPDVPNADGEQLLELPEALLDELDTLLGAALAENPGPIVIDPATGIREITPGGIATGQHFTTGRNAEGRFASWDAIRLTVTLRGHWYRSDDPMDGFSNDRLCRGCGHHGHFDYILDYRPCATPAGVVDVLKAFGR